MSSKINSGDFYLLTTFPQTLNIGLKSVIIFITTITFSIIYVWIINHTNLIAHGTTEADIQCLNPEA